MKLVQGQVALRVRNEHPTCKHQQASHLCGNRRCIEHLVWEDAWYNTWRNDCLLEEFAGHNLTCPHTPPCMISELRQKSIINAAMQQKIDSVEQEEQADFDSKTEKEKKAIMAKRARSAANKQISSQQQIDARVRFISFEYFRI